MTRDKFVAYSVAVMCFALWVSDSFVAEAKTYAPKFTDRVAEACLPPVGERRVVELAVEDGTQTVRVTSQKFIGERKGALQYEVIATEDLK